MNQPDHHKQSWSSADLRSLKREWKLFRDEARAAGVQPDLIAFDQVFGEIIGRTPCAVKRTRSRLGLVMFNQRTPQPVVPAERPKNTKRTWDPKDEEFLRESYRFTDDADLAALLDRTPRGVRHRRQLLDLLREDENAWSKKKEEPVVILPPPTPPPTLIRVKLAEPSFVEHVPPKGFFARLWQWVTG